MLAIATGVMVVCFHDFIHPFMKGTMEFLPLMINSVSATAFNFVLILRFYFLPAQHLQAIME